MATTKLTFNSGSGLWTVGSDSATTANIIFNKLPPLKEKKVPEKPKTPTLHKENDTNYEEIYDADGEDVIGYIRWRDDGSIIFQHGGDYDGEGKVVILQKGTIHIPVKRRKKSILPAKNQLPVKELSDLASLD